MIRPRRNRKSKVVRSLIRETSVSANDLIYPLFLLESPDKSIAVESMPGISRLGVDNMLKEIEECLKLGIKTFDIFPVVEERHKDKTATKSYDANFFYLKALKEIKKKFPENFFK